MILFSSDPLYKKEVMNTRGQRWKYYDIYATLNAYVLTEAA